MDTVMRMMNTDEGEMYDGSFNACPRVVLESASARRSMMNRLA